MVYLVFTPKNHIDEMEHYLEENKELYYSLKDKFIMIGIENYNGNSNEDGYAHVLKEMLNIDLNYLDKFVYGDNKGLFNEDKDQREFKASDLSFVPKYGSVIVRALSLKDRANNLHSISLKTWFELMRDEKNENEIISTLDELDLKINLNYIYDDFHDKCYDLEMFFNLIFNVNNNSELNIQRNEFNISAFSENYEDFIEKFEEIVK